LLGEDIKEFEVDADDFREIFFTSAGSDAITHNDSVNKHNGRIGMAQRILKA
jgi:hypothetical protein